MSKPQSIARAEAFAKAHGFEIPILMAPMAGACPPGLAAAVAKAGGLGGCGCLLMQPNDIRAWGQAVRQETNGAFQMNLWVPDPAPHRDATHETAVRDFLGMWGPEVAPTAGDAPLLDFDAQCQAMLEAGPAIISSIMGIFPEEYVAAMKARGIKWFANATTVREAQAAVQAGADVVIAQGSEAGGHRGAFDAEQAERTAVGLFALLPAMIDAVDAPVIATGGIADARGIAAALTMGASAVQIGTGFLRTPEAKLPSAWTDALGEAMPEDTMVTRAFSGRAGRSLTTKYALAAAAKDAPAPAPYPVQRALTGAMRAQGSKDNDIDRIQAWAGQSAGLAQDRPAAELTEVLWAEAQTILGH